MESGGAAVAERLATEEPAIVPSKATKHENPSINQQVFAISMIPKELGGWRRRHRVSIRPTQS